MKDEFGGKTIIEFLNYKNCLAATQLNDKKISGKKMKLTQIVLKKS